MTAANKKMYKRLVKRYTLITRITFWSFLLMIISAVAIMSITESLGTMNDNVRMILRIIGIIGVLSMIIAFISAIYSDRYLNKRKLYFLMIKEYKQNMYFNMVFDLIESGEYYKAWQIYKTCITPKSDMRKFMQGYLLGYLQHVNDTEMRIIVITRLMQIRDDFDLREDYRTIVRFN